MFNCHESTHSTLCVKHWPANKHELEEDTFPSIPFLSFNEPFKKLAWCNEAQTNAEGWWDTHKCRNLMLKRCFYHSFPTYRKPWSILSSSSASAYSRCCCFASWLLMLYNCWKTFHWQYYHVLECHWERKCICVTCLTMADHRLNDNKMLYINLLTVLQQSQMTNLMILLWPWLVGSRSEGCRCPCNSLASWRLTFQFPFGIILIFWRPISIYLYPQ